MFYTLVSRTAITKINTPRDYFYIFLLGSLGYVILHWFLHMEQRDGIVEKVKEYLYYAMVIDIITAFTWMAISPAKTDKKPEDVESKGQQEQESQQYTPEQKKVIMQRMQEARRLQQLRQKELADRRAGDDREGQGQRQGRDRNHENEKINDEEHEEDYEQDEEPESEKKPSLKTNPVQPTQPPSLPIKNKNVKQTFNKQERENEEPKKSIFSKSEDSKDSKDSKDYEDTVSKNNNETEHKSVEKQIVKPNSNSTKSKKKLEDRHDTEIPVFEGKKKKTESK